MDSDGDSVDGDAYESGEEITEFYDEVKETLKRALSDAVVYNAVIRELEEARIANSQEPATLNSAVIKALIEMSCEKFNSNSDHVDIRHYARELDALLTVFKPLLRSLKRNRGTQLQDLNAVVPPLMKLLQGRQLSERDFLDEQKQNILVNTLRAGDIIGDEQVQDVISALDQILFPIVQQAITSTTSNMPEECKISRCKKHLANLCTGEFCGTFDHRGGRLSTFMSDDYLDIPRDAIPKGESWKISGNIFTSLDGYINFVNKHNGEHFIAPAIHYNVEGGRSFNKFVKVVIHHSITNKSLLEKVTVLLKEDAEQPQKLMLNKEIGKTQTQPWFEIDNVHITVYTNHFSAILCLLCDKQHTEQKRIAGYLYGRIDRNEVESIATMELYLFTVDDVQKQSVFTEAFTTEMNQSKKHLLGTKMFSSSLKTLSKEDKLSTDISIYEEHWNYAKGSDYPNEDIPLCDEIDCVCDTSPHCLGTYTMRGKSNSLSGTLIASIRNEGSTNRALKIKIPFHMKLSATDSSEAKLLSPDHWLVSDMKLYTVAKFIKPNAWYEIGLKLGIPAIELDSIEKNCCGEKFVRTIFEMLRMWRDRQPRSEQEVLQARDGLRKTLIETLNNDAVSELDKNGNDDNSHAIVTHNSDSQSDTSDSSG